MLPYGTAGLSVPSGRDPRRIAKELEGIVWQMVVRELGRGTRGFVPAGLAGDIFGDMLAQAIARQAAEGADLGMADVLVRQLGLDRRPPDGRRLPADGKITSRYGYRADPFTGRRAFHHGLDIAAAEGSPIRSVGAGKVVHVGRMGGYGLAVVVEQDDGARVVYGHCARSLVAAGERVEAGRQIAEVGRSGRATGPHLHLEVRLEGVSIDPEAYLAGRSAGLKNAKNLSMSVSGEVSHPHPPGGDR